DRLLEREPRSGAVFGLVCRTEVFAGARHQALVALPFVPEHPEAEPAFLVFRDAPQARRCPVLAPLGQRTRDAGDAVDLSPPVSGRDAGLERVGEAFQRPVGIEAIEREVSEAVQRARQLLFEAELSRAPRRVLEDALGVGVISPIAVRLAEKVELVQ